MRQEFSRLLLEEMRKNKKIVFLTADLGYKLFDDIICELPTRAINVGASEQTMLDMAVGFAYQGKIPFCYSITPFLLYRPFETVKLYINGEKLNVKLIGSGRAKDYSHDGPSHDASDVEKFFLYYDGQPADAMLNNIRAFWPDTNKQMVKNFDTILKTTDPCFLSLRR